MAQPIVRGVQAVGNVDIIYEYNNGVLKVPPFWGNTNGKAADIDTSNGGVKVAGIRLDSEFMRASQQIASSFTIPLLGGGGLALTNNNRTGQLTINCTRSAPPNAESGGNMEMTAGVTTSNGYGIGVTSEDGALYYDMTILAQYQQGQRGGDSWGSTITVVFDFNGMGIRVQFLGCTIEGVAPLVLTGNDAANYSVVINYLDWVCGFYENPQASGA